MPLLKLEFEKIINDKNNSFESESLLLYNNGGKIKNISLDCKVYLRVVYNKNGIEKIKLIRLDGYFEPYNENTRSFEVSSNKVAEFYGYNNYKTLYKYTSMMYNQPNVISITREAVVYANYYDIINQLHSEYYTTDTKGNYKSIDNQTAVKIDNNSEWIDFSALDAQKILKSIN